MSTVHRLDNCTWAYRTIRELHDQIKEIRIHLSFLKDAEALYTLIKTVAKIFDDHTEELSHNFFQKGFAFVISSPSIIEGRYIFSSQKSTFPLARCIKAIKYKAMQYIPFSRVISTKDIVDVYVENAKNCVLTRIYFSVARIFPQAIERPLEFHLSDIPGITLPQDWEEATYFKLFADPFTTLATHAFQCFEGPYIMEKEHRADFQYVLTGQNQLSLALVDSQKNSFDENRQVLRHFSRYLIAEFGAHIVEQLQESYGIDLSDMIEKGKPLLTDHVAKCNVGVNDISLEDVERLWRDLLSIEKQLMALPKEMLVVEAWKQLFVMTGKQIFFPGRVRRKIEEVCPTVENFQDLFRWFLENGPAQSVQNLPNEQAARVVRLLVSSEKQLERAFTGRKIEHRSITGFQTMGNPNVENPCRDLFELLHIFSEFRQQNSWSNFYELLAHVLCKKNLFRKNVDYRKKHHHIGMIIPGPIMPGEKETYFYTKALIDDGRGCFSYTLEPVSKHGLDHNRRYLPWIKVYRSTNSNSNAPHWYDSLLADLNPLGSPGERYLKLSCSYERGDVEKRTIPLWVGHLLYALKARDEANEEVCIQELKNAAALMDEYLIKIAPTKRLDSSLRLRSFLKKEDWDGFLDVLVSVAKDLRELPEHKFVQDLFFIGHSLGGGLAQMHTWYCMINEQRMPLPKCDCFCFNYNGPAIGAQKNCSFLEFGRKHAPLFQALGIKYRIQHQFEYGDFVPEGGQVHLGATKDQKDDSSWLEFISYVFTPMKDAKALSIRTLPTHGRRIETAIVGRDYEFKPLTQNALFRFDTAWYLGWDLQKQFGYRFFVSPKLSEFFRRSFGACIYFPMLGIRPFMNYKLPGADDKGVVSIRYGESKQ